MPMRISLRPSFQGLGKTATLVVTIKKGKNSYKCTVAGHAAGGMKGTFTGT